MPACRCSVRVSVVCLLVGATLLLSGPALAQKKEGKKGAVLARTRSALGTIFASRKDGEPRSLELYSEIQEGMRLFSPPGQRGVLEVREGDLMFTLVGNLPEISPSPVLETSVTLKPSKDHAVDAKLEQGILIIEAGKGSTGGKAAIDIQDKRVSVTLHKNSAVALELIRYLPEGTRFTKMAKMEPIAELWLFVLRGKVDVAAAKESLGLTGPALLHWTLRSGLQGPLALRKMPEWAQPHKIKDKEALALLKAAEKIRHASEKTPMAWAEALKSKQETERVVGVYHAAALVQTSAILEVLNRDASPKVRRAAVTALRVFSAEGHDHAHRLHRSLVGNEFKPGQAGIFMHLLLGFTPGERNRPEIYESLIGYLHHDHQAIRHLAGEQLTALVPAGREIGYDPAAAADARMKAQAAWRKLIPEGTLPKAEK